MADKKLTIEVDSNADKAVTQFVALRKQVKDATVAFQAAQAQFGEFSKEAVKAGQKLAALKETMADSQATANAFKPGGGFKALADAGSLAATSMGAMTGAMQLMGGEGKDLEKTLVQIQSAMAIADALSQYDNAIDTFKNIKASAQAAFTAIKEGIGSTGIGLLLLALGAVVIYWDDITAALGRASTAQKAYNETVEDSAKAMATEIAKVSEVNAAFKDARSGVISRREALEKYNATFGETLGKTNDFNEAEKRMKENTGDYIKSVGLRAQALALYSLAAQKAAEKATLKPGGYDTVNATSRALNMGGEVQAAQVMLAADKLAGLVTDEQLKVRLKRIEALKKIQALPLQQRIDALKQVNISEEKAQLQKDADEIKALADSLLSQANALTNKIGAADKNEAYDAANEAAKKQKSIRDAAAAQQKSDADAYYQEAKKDNEDRSRTEEQRITDEYEKRRKIVVAEYGKTSKQAQELETDYWNDINEVRLRQQEVDNKINEDKKIKAAEDRQNEIDAYNYYMDYIVQLEIDAARTILNERKLVAEGKKELLDIELNDVKAGFALLSSIDKKSKVLQAASIIAENAVGAAKIVINTRAANAAAKLKYALAPGGEAIAASIAAANNVGAGISIAAMAVSTYKALAALKEGGSVASGGGGSEGGGAPQFNIVGTSGNNQLAATIAAQQNQPVNAYVVGSDMTTQQALDRNRITTATFL